MEKRNEWNVGDIIKDLKNNIHVIVMEKTGNETIMFMRRIDNYWDYHSMPLRFMDRYFINTGRSGKGLDILYGTKSEDNSHYLYRKG